MFSQNLGSPVAGSIFNPFATVLILILYTPGTVLKTHFFLNMSVFTIFMAYEYDSEDSHRRWNKVFCLHNVRFWTHFG
jgi:hypothetical protein